MIPCPDDVIVPAADPETPARLAIIIIALALVITDVVLELTGHPTISTYIQHKSKKFPWLKWVGFAGLAFLAWHLFVGFPW